MELTFTQRRLMSDALTLAAAKYVGFAADAMALPGGERLQQQFLRQATDTCFLALMVGESLSVEIGAAELAEGDNRREAAQLTNQQFADTINERLAVAKS